MKKQSLHRLANSVDICNTLYNRLTKFDLTMVQEAVSERTVQVSQSQGSYTLTETETDIDKIVTGTNGISVSVQYEHLQNSMQDIFCRYRF